MSETIQNMTDERIERSDVVPIVSRSAYSPAVAVPVQRVWAMPSMHTFEIPPVAELVRRYVGDGVGWADPFAGETSPAEWTNDLNETKPTKYHMDGEDFCGVLPDGLNGVLFDPPYSSRQTKEVYEGIGVTMTMRDSQDTGYRRVKLAVYRKVRMGGLVICCGWNSAGFGKGLGFVPVELLLVCHGGNHNDTIVVVERKQYEQLQLPL